MRFSSTSSRNSSFSEALVDATFVAAALAAMPLTAGMSAGAIAAMIPEIAAAGVHTEWLFSPQCKAMTSTRL